MNKLGERYNLSEVVIKDYFQNKDAKLLYMYAVASFITADLGYMEKREFQQSIVDLCNVANKTAKRWIKELHNHKLVRIRKGIVHPLGRGRFEMPHVPTQKYIRFHKEHLIKYTNFKAHAIRQIALFDTKEI